MTLKTLFLLVMLICVSLFLALSFLMVKIQIKEEIKRYEKWEKQQTENYYKKNFIGKIESFKF